MVLQQWTMWVGYISVTTTQLISSSHEGQSVREWNIIHLKYWKCMTKHRHVKLTGPENLLNRNQSPAYHFYLTFWLVQLHIYSKRHLANGSTATFMILRFVSKQYYHVLMSIHKNVAGWSAICWLSLGLLPISMMLWKEYILSFVPSCCSIFYKLMKWCLLYKRALLPAFIIFPLLFF
jgi:hypothetical protein